MFSWIGKGLKSVAQGVGKIFGIGGDKDKQVNINIGTDGVSFSSSAGAYVLEPYNPSRHGTIANYKTYVESKLAAGQIDYQTATKALAAVGVTLTPAYGGGLTLDSLTSGGIMPLLLIGGIAYFVFRR